MFDEFALLDNGFGNVTDESGKVTGFQLKTQIPYYRGIPLSMVEWINVKVDGEEVVQSKIKFSPNGEDYFTLDEMTTVTTYKWEFGQEAIVFVEKEGGLSKGSHEISLKQAIRNAYYPFPIEARRTKTFEIA